MFTNEDFEQFYIRYTTDALSRGESIQNFGLRNDVISYNLYAQWYKDTCHRIVEFQVESQPSHSSSSELQIIANIRTNRGLHVQQRNLSYPVPKVLIQKLEGLYRECLDRVPMNKEKLFLYT